MAKASVRSTTKMISFANMSAFLLVHRRYLRIPRGTYHAIVSLCEMWAGKRTFLNMLKYDVIPPGGLYNENFDFPTDTEQ